MLQTILNTLRSKDWPLHVASNKILKDIGAQKHAQDNTLENMDALNNRQYNTLKNMTVWGHGKCSTLVDMYFAIMAT